VASIRPLERLTFREFVIRHGADIMDVDGASVDERSPRDESTRQRQAAILEDLTRLNGCRDWPDTRRDSKRIAVGDQDEDVRCVAESSGTSHDRPEDGLRRGG
jgi:hypothetical protein